MGGKLTKSKDISICEKTEQQQQQKIETTTIENSNNHLDVTTNEDTKQITKKIKKKQESKSDKKSSKIKVDKSTNTENCLLPSSTFSEQLVGEKISAMNNNVLLDINPAQINEGYQPETPLKDVQELWNRCAQNSIISNGLQNDKQEYATNILNNTDDQDNNENQQQ
ncbi:unnamed protein product [Adineta steineri]|uniref:Uncharacterized protein n=1 Tax=Adineta steineri TaxID=433720 RepID=A0A819A327_9BILA|nr:unnamed protein product [Adineta steineri]CAF3778322.1 unnamed protein product [Adineta steineri]